MRGPLCRFNHGTLYPGAIVTVKYSQERMEHMYEIGVTLSQRSKMQVVSVCADSAFEAVILGLSEMGLVSLEMVTGITICEVDL